MGRPSSNSIWSPRSPWIRILDLKVQYNKEFQKVISNKQIAALYHAEEEFKKELLNIIKKGKDKDHKRKR